MKNLLPLLLLLFTACATSGESYCDLVEDEPSKAYSTEKESTSKKK